MSSLSITIAKDAGFCFGVRRAIEIARKAAKQYGKVAMLGDIVHNEQVVADLKNLGVAVFDDVDSIPVEMPVIFRSHGTRREIWQWARERGLKIIDATCPLVNEIHAAARDLEEDGRQVIIIGDPGHDEVEGIASQVHNPIIVPNKSETNRLKKIRKAGVVIQSTQFNENVNDIASVLIAKISDLRIINTVCKPTRDRQSQLRELAKNNDVMIIVGSFTSANTKRLAAIARTINPHSYQVQSAEDVRPEWFKNMNSVGISAGASTPDKIVMDVTEKISALPL